MQTYRRIKTSKLCVVTYQSAVGTDRHGGVGRPAMGVCDGAVGGTQGQPVDAHRHHLRGGLCMIKCKFDSI